MRFHGKQNALKGVNGQIKSTQSQLKDVNKLLKLEPGNTELLAQKHKLLAETVSETKEKLAQSIIIPIELNIADEKKYKPAIETILENDWYHTIKYAVEAFRVPGRQYKINIFNLVIAFCISIK